MIGVDWGSSNLRAYRFGPDGGVAEQRNSGAGAASRVPEAFEPVLAALRAGWTRAREPVVLAGMVGRRGGWRKVPYPACPADPHALAASVLALEASFGPCFPIPGSSVRRPNGIADVMRGEETQILGARIETATVVLPGTHTKWARIVGGRIVDFVTAMTRELYGLLRAQSMLAQCAVKDAPFRPPRIASSLYIPARRGHRGEGVGPGRAGPFVRTAPVGSDIRPRLWRSGHAVDRDDHGRVAPDPPADDLQGNIERVDNLRVT